MLKLKCYYTTSNINGNVLLLQHCPVMLKTSDGNILLSLTHEDKSPWNHTIIRFNCCSKTLQNIAVLTFYKT